MSDGYPSFGNGPIQENLAVGKRCVLGDGFIKAREFHWAWAEASFTVSLRRKIRLERVGCQTTEQEEQVGTWKLIGNCRHLRLHSYLENCSILSTDNYDNRHISKKDLVKNHIEAVIQVRVAI